MEIFFLKYECCTGKMQFAILRGSLIFKKTQQFKKVKYSVHFMPDFMMVFQNKVGIIMPHMFME